MLWTLTCCACFLAGLAAGRRVFGGKPLYRCRYRTCEEEWLDAYSFGRLEAQEDLRLLEDHLAERREPSRACRMCGCTEDDCSGCAARTGAPRDWVDVDLCSACACFPPETAQDRPGAAAWRLDVRSDRPGDGEPRGQGGPP